MLDGLAPREGLVGSQFHDQPLGYRLQRVVIVLFARVRSDRLTTRGQDASAAVMVDGFQLEVPTSPPLPHGSVAIAILDRGLIARLVLGPDRAAIDRKAAIPIHQDEDASMLDRFNGHFELTEPRVDFVGVIVLTKVFLLQRAIFGGECSVR